METRAAAERWRATWERCWQAHDPGPILALYAPGAFFQSHPFREPQEPREYVVPTLAAEKSATCVFGDPVVQGDRAAVEWRGDVVLADGATEKLVGVSLLRFDADGLVVEQRDVWAQA